MKEKHIRIEVASAEDQAVPAAPIKAIGWNLASRAEELHLQPGSIVDLAYKIRENDHPQYGGLQIEIAGIESPTKIPEA